MLEIIDIINDDNSDNKKLNIMKIKNRTDNFICF